MTLECIKSSTNYTTLKGSAKWKALALDVHSMLAFCQLQAV